MTMFGAIAMRGLGVLLLVAAALKLYGLAVEPVGGVGFFSEPWVQTLIVEWEIALGIWLVWGVNRALAWLAAMATFVTFAGVSAWQVWIGQTSCGCFGAIRVNPWVALVVDAVALGLLASSRTHSWNTHAPYQTAYAARPLATAVCGVLVALGLLAGIGTWVYGSPAAALAFLRGERLRVVPGVLDVGEGRLGQSKEQVVYLRNWSDVPIRVVGGSSDCSCIVTRDLPLTVAPVEQSPLTVEIRFSGRPGQFTRVVSLHTDDKRFGVIHFHLTGQCHVQDEGSFRGVDQ